MFDHFDKINKNENIPHVLGDRAAAKDAAGRLTLRRFGPPEAIAEGVSARVEENVEETVAMLRRELAAVRKEAKATLEEGAAARKAAAAARQKAAAAYEEAAAAYKETAALRPPWCVDELHAHQK